MKRLLATVLIILFPMLAYYYVIDLLDKRKLALSTYSFYEAQASCRENPTAHCLGELAVLSLPPRTRFGELDDVVEELRLLGFAEIIDTRLKAGEGDSLRNADAINMYHTLKKDIATFTNQPPHGNPFVYVTIASLLNNDYRNFGGQSDLGQAEEKARMRRGPIEVGPEHDALLEVWRKSLDTNARYASDWLVYTRVARELGNIEEARDALFNAMQMEYSGLNHWSVVFETWNLYGESEALDVALKIQETDRKSYILLNVTNRLLRAGEPEKASVFFASFEETYAPSSRSSPLLRRGNLRSAAIAASGLGHADIARMYAEKYAGRINPATAIYNSREAARLYVDINEVELALETINLIVESAPEPGETVRTFYVGSWSTTDRRNEYLGTAMDYLCRLGRYDETFRMGEGITARGDMATSGCYSALHDTEAPMSIEEVTDALALRSPKRLERMLAAEYVEEGNYEEAAAVIRQSLATVPASEHLTMSQSNVLYLRLAIAMRDEALVNEVVTTIIDQSVDVIGLKATRLYAKVGALLHKWPELAGSPQ